MARPPPVSFVRRICDRAMWPKTTAMIDPPVRPKTNEAISKAFMPTSATGNVPGLTAETASTVGSDASRCLTNPAMNRGRQTGRAPISRAWMRSHAAVRPGAPYPRTGASNCMTSIADANMPSPYRTGVARATSMSLGSRPRSRSQPITYSTAVATTSSGAVPEPPTTSSTSVKAPARTKKGMACRRRSAGICRSSRGGPTTGTTPSAGRGVGVRIAVGSEGSANGVWSVMTPLPSQIETVHGPGLGRVSSEPLPVRVARADAFDAQLAVAPGGGVGAADLDEGDGPVADGLVELGDDLGRDRTELGGPGGGVGTDHDHALVVRLRRRVRGDRFADDIGPALEECVDRDADLPAAVGDVRVEDAAGSLRVPRVVARARHLRRGGRPGCTSGGRSCRTSGASDAARVVRTGRVVLADRVGLGRLSHRPHPPA